MTKTGQSFESRIVWAPAVLVLTTVLLQLAVWDAPGEIRWDGTFHFWPIAWMVCCGSPAKFTAVWVTYSLACISTIAIAFREQKIMLAIDVAMLVAFPLGVYVYMYWLYFD